MADLRDFTGKNRKFTGTIGERISTGTTAERDTAFGAGTLRFNTQTSLMEYYTGVLWKSVDAPPTVTAITPTNVLTSQFPDSSTSITFAITGSLFSAGAIVTFIGTDGSIITADTVDVTSQSSITATVNQKVLFSNSLDPYDVKVENVSGLFAVLDNQINVNQAVTFTNAAGSLGNFTNDGVSVSVSAGGTDPEGGAIVYSVSSGTLPAWASLNSSTGLITGTTSGSAATSTFTIAARDAASNVSLRQFSITTRVPVITTFNSPGTFSVPSTTTSVDVLVVAGGGGAGSQHAGGAGGGGLIFRPAFPVSASTSIPVTVGGGGGPVTDGTQPPAAADSIFNSPTGVLTAKAGGGGGRGWTNANAGHPGGSGGGGSGPGANAGAGGTQPSQPGDSGTFGFGNPGAGATIGPNHAGGGGGGAGAAGSAPPTDGRGGNGGAGRTYTISGSPVAYAGGGGGGGHGASTLGGTGGTGGGGNGGTHPGNNGQPGTTNRGGGAGAGAFGGGQGGAGGSGVVIVKS
jgi:hypothetical protein